MFIQALVFALCLWGVSELIVAIKADDKASRLISAAIGIVAIAIAWFLGK